MFIHHFILILGFGTSVVHNVSAAELIACFFISEISNPPMHLRTILKQVRLRYTQLWETSEMSYLCKAVLKTSPVHRGAMWTGTQDYVRHHSLLAITSSEAPGAGTTGAVFLLLGKVRAAAHSEWSRLYSFELSNGWNASRREFT